MKAEIITIGTEILLGDIIDNNSAFIARELKDLGINVYNLQSVGDNHERLKESLALAQSRADVVFAIGGLGPTSDDITKNVLAELLEAKLITHEPSYRKMKEAFAQSNFHITPNNLKQAQIPEGTEAIPNPKGLATGVWSEKNDVITILLPGPPYEMRAMFLEEIKARLQKPDDEQIYSHNYRFLGVGESHLDHELADWMGSANPSLAPYAGQGEVCLRLTAMAKTEQEAETIMAPVDAKIRQRFGDSLYGVDVSDIGEAVHNFLLLRKRTIATAESCTGGMIAKALTERSGSSEYFMGGVVSYSNQAKIDLLKVPKEILNHYGAVSPETAIAMAKGAKKAFGTDLAISSTGIAGPRGATNEKPVGTVYMGLVTPNEIQSYKLIDLPSNHRNRSMIRHMTVQYALYYVLKSLCD